MPDLCSKYLEWKKLHPMFWYMSLVGPEDSVFSPVIFDYKVFEPALNRMHKMLPTETWDDRATIDTFTGIAAMLEKNCSNNTEQQHRLVEFFTENDRRRNTSWRKTFPWLVNILEKNNVV
jgi:hypothetical protein